MIHSLQPHQMQGLEKIQARFNLLMKDIEALCPASRERSIAITELETGMMWAVKAYVLACNTPKVNAADVLSHAKEVQESTMTNVLQAEMCGPDTKLAASSPFTPVECKVVERYEQGVPQGNYKIIFLDKDGKSAEVKQVFPTEEEAWEYAYGYGAAKCSMTHFGPGFPNVVLKGQITHAFNTKWDELIAKENSISANPPSECGHSAGAYSNSIKSYFWRGEK